MENNARASILSLLKQRYPKPNTMLTHHNAWQLLAATVLAAQCTDARVNTVTPKLFRLWPGPKELAQASIEDIEAVIHPLGFYHSKAKHLLGAAARIVRDFDGNVPKTLAELITLPGVARKTANVVLWGAFGINEGLAVDTHVKRISFRLGLTSHINPVHIERDLMLAFPQEEWGNVNHMLVWFGRDVCHARRPSCGECELSPLCPKHGVKGA